MSEKKFSSQEGIETTEKEKVKVRSFQELHDEIKMHLGLGTIKDLDRALEENNLLVLEYTARSLYPDMRRKLFDSTHRKLLSLQIIARLLSDIEPQIATDALYYFSEYATQEHINVFFQLVRMHFTHKRVQFGSDINNTLAILEKSALQIENLPLLLDCLNYGKMRDNLPRYLLSFPILLKYPEVCKILFSDYFPPTKTERIGRYRYENCICGLVHEDVQIQETAVQNLLKMKVDDLWCICEYLCLGEPGSIRVEYNKYGKSKKAATLGKIIRECQSPVVFAAILKKTTIPEVLDEIVTQIHQTSAGFSPIALLAQKKAADSRNRAAYAEKYKERKRIIKRERRRRNGPSNY